MRLIVEYGSSCKCSYWFWLGQKQWDLATSYNSTPNPFLVMNVLSFIISSFSPHSLCIQLLIFLLDWVEICTEHPMDNLQRVSM